MPVSGRIRFAQAGGGPLPRPAQADEAEVLHALGGKNRGWTTSRPPPRHAVWRVSRSPGMRASARKNKTPKKPLGVPQAAVPDRTREKSTASSQARTIRARPGRRWLFH